ncbi:MAG TPA: 50S ribosomal protein L10 [Actinomycetota bacterium]|jgi:large subunit ribosomal protein L10
MPKTEKIERVSELKERIEGSQALLLTEYRGLTVSDITELRRSLAENGASFAVVKNTLMRRAVTDAGVGELESFLQGPSAVAFVAGDPVAAAKKVVDAAKRYPALVLKGGYLDGKVLSAGEAKALAELESREVMLSKIAGMLKSEMTRAAAMFAAAPARFLSLLEAYKEKLPAGPEAEADAEAPQASGATAATDGTTDGAADEDTEPVADATTAATDPTTDEPEATGTDHDDEEGKG